MDYRHRRRPSSDRFLTAFTSPAASYASSGDAANELSEDDVFFTGADFFNPPSTFSTLSPKLLNQNSNNKRIFKLEPETFGILAVLPEFNHKPQPTSTMTIPLTRRNSGNISELLSNSFSMPAKYHQSAPMKVPMMQMRERRRRRKGSAFGYEDFLDVDDDEEDEGEMLPPHEIVARKMPKSPVLSCSVLEGAGRTLKGRDLRQVRNAVFRQTGFVD